MSEFLLEGRRFGVADAGHRLSEAELAAFEEQVGTRLPDQLRSFYLRWNGGLPYPVEVPEDSAVWVRLRWRPGAEAARVGPAASLNNLFEVDADSSVDFLTAHADFEGRIPRDCLAFAIDPGGSLFLIGIGEHNVGRIYYWARAFEEGVEDGEAPGYDNVADVAGSFVEFLLALRQEPEIGEPLDAWVQRAYSP